MDRILWHIQGQKYRNCYRIVFTLREECVCGRNFCGFCGIWEIRKSLFLQKVRSIVNRKIFFPAKRSTFAEPQKLFPAKPSSFAEPQKFLPVKCLFPKQNTMNTSPQWKSLEFKDNLEIQKWSLRISLLQDKTHHNQLELDEKVITYYTSVRT